MQHCSTVVLMDYHSKTDKYDLHTALKKDALNKKTVRHYYPYSLPLTKQPS